MTWVEGRKANYLDIVETYFRVIFYVAERNQHVYVKGNHTKISINLPLSVSLSQMRIPCTVFCGLERTVDKTKRKN